MYEEGQPFNFQLNYENKTIQVEYIPLQWETMTFEQEIHPIPKQILQKIKQREIENEI